MLPGDELLSAPMISWTNARTINASPNEVWPWLAQMGVTRWCFQQLHLHRGSAGRCADRGRPAMR